MKIDISSYSSGIGVAIVFALAGLGLFLTSIKLMSSSMRNMSTGFTSGVIKKITKNKWTGLFVGILFTTMIQSSDGAVALVIGLISAGLLKFKKAIPFILGANIGTATTAVIVALAGSSGGAFEFVQYLPLFAFFGAGVIMFAKENKKVNVGMLIFAVGCIFLGLKVMGSGMKSITGESWFSSIVASVGTNPWIALSANTALTGVVQSSSATVTVVQGIYMIDATGHIQMGLDSAIAMVIGANIGTTFTALIASIGGNKEARKVAVVWLTTNILMALAVMPFIRYYADFINIIQPVNINSISKADIDIANSILKFQLAWAHLIFNAALVFIFIWLVKPLVWWTNIVVPEKKKTHKYEFNISTTLLEEDPIFAFEAAKKASQELGHMTLDSIILLRQFIADTKKETYNKHRELINLIDTSRKALSNYLVEIGSRDIPKRIANQHMSLILSARSLERVPVLGSQFIDALRASMKKNKFELSVSDVKEIDNLLSIVNLITKRGVKQLGRYSRKRKSEMDSLFEKLNILIDKYSQDFIKRKNKTSFDYLAEIKLIERMGHHGMRLQKYVRKGRKEVDAVALDEKLEKELSLKT